MKKLKVTLSTAKIVILAIFLTFAFYVGTSDGSSLTRAAYAGLANAFNNVVQAGEWAIETPVNEGWNTPTDSATANEQPLDLACGSVTNGGDPAHPRVSHNWSEITGVNIRYQREVTWPSGAVGFYYAGPNYTPFSSFGSDAGTPGLWRTRVRAFEDMDGNGVYDVGTDRVSDWSNYCDLTLDTGVPTASYVNIPLPVGSEIATSTNFEIRAAMADDNMESYKVTIYDSGAAVVDDPAVQSFTASVSNYVVHTWNVSAFPDDTYTVELTVNDVAGNSTTITEDVILDRTVAPPLITVINSPEKEIVNRVLNSGFEEELKAWTVNGKAVVLTEPENEVAARGGTRMLRLGSTDGAYTTASTLYQEVTNDGYGLRSIGFWYNFVSYEDNPGFDESAFAVYLGDEMVYQVWAQDVLNEAGLNSSGWQYVSVYVVGKEAGHLPLKFLVQGNDDGEKASFVYLDDVTTNTTVVNQSAIFTLHADNPDSNETVHYRYYVNGAQYSGMGESGLTFSIAAQPDDQLIEFWSTNEFEEEGAHKQIQVFYDNTAPSKVSDLTVYNEGEGEYSVTFTAPSDNLAASVSEYDFRYSLEPITAANWNDATTPQRVVDDSLPGNVRAPRMASQTEDVIFNIPEVSEEGESYYFAVRSADATKNWSAISNVATPVIVSGSEIYLDSDTVINEIMYNPAGSDTGSMPNGEWVEFYNASDKDVDLSGYVIKDAAGRELEITKENSDNNLRLDDGGETVIPAKGHLVTYKNGYRMFNNDGDTVSLYNRAGSVVSSYIYQGGVEEGKTEGREASGSEAWALAMIATAGRSNAVTIQDLVPVARLWQSAPQNVKATIFDAVLYNQAKYVVEYTRLAGEEEIKEALTGDLEINGQEVSKDGLYFGTCSTGGTCVDHLGVKADSIKLNVILKGDGMEDKVLEQGLMGSWEEPAAEEI